MPISVFWFEHGINHLFLFYVIVTLLNTTIISRNDPEANKRRIKQCTKNVRCFKLQLWRTRAETSV